MGKKSIKKKNGNLLFNHENQNVKSVFINIHSIND